MTNKQCWKRQIDSYLQERIEAFCRFLAKEKGIIYAAERRRERNDNWDPSCVVSPEMISILSKDQHCHHFPLEHK